MCAETIDSARAVWDEVWRTFFSMTRSDSLTSQTRRTFAAVRRELASIRAESRFLVEAYPAARSVRAFRARHI